MTECYWCGEEVDDEHDCRRVGELPPQSGSHYQEEGSE